MKPEEVIKVIRESFGASIAIYTCGNCYQFYEILKVIFPEAEAYYDSNHVWTKIGNKFYDIRGEKHWRSKPLLKLITDPDLIFSLSANKFSDKRRREGLPNRA